jgi:hypothetical protein
MLIPTAQHFIDNNGNKFVQLTFQDWDNFVKEFKRLERLLLLKSKLKVAFQEMREIQKGEKQGLYQ